jgi:hypothetical protein
VFSKRQIKSLCIGKATEFMGLLILLSAFFFHVGSLDGATIPSNLTVGLLFNSERGELSGRPGTAAMPVLARWSDQQGQAPVREGPPSRKDQKKLDNMPAIAEEDERHPTPRSGKRPRNQPSPIEHQPQLPANKNISNEQKPAPPVSANNPATPKSTNQKSDTENSSNRNSNNPASTTEGLASPPVSHSGNDVGTGFFLFMMALILVGLLALLLIGKRIYGLMSKR